MDDDDRNGYNTPMETIQAPLVPPLDPSLTAISALDDLADYLRDHREAIFARIRAGASGLVSARDLSDLVDSVIRRMLAIGFERVGRVSSTDTVPIAVVATGGYGRRELCPYSDVDITFIPHRESDPIVDALVREMFSMLMRVFIDRLGMEVGYAYRLLSDCTALDHQTASGLLDARLVAGNDRLFIQFEHDFWSYFNPADFVFAKLEERRRQQLKFGLTPRGVEPNLKDGPGGLRDIQAAVWVSQARLSLAAARLRGDRAWEVLKREADVTEAEADALGDAKEFLFRVRNALHIATGAERDHLVVTRQEQIAEMLGYGEVYTSDAPPVERFMRDYYSHATAVHRISNSVMRRAENSRMFLGIGLDCHRKLIEAANPALEHEDPVWMLWACEIAQKYGLDLSDSLEHAIVELARRRPPIQDLAQAGEVFTRLLASPKGAYPILQRMADLGILGWLIPEIGEVMDLIPYDSSHDYTVGQHTLFVVRNLDQLRTAVETRTAEGGDRGPLTEAARELHQILMELPHPEHLYLAALLHDAGKGSPDRPHADVGAELAREICLRIGWSEPATAAVEFLVQNHLLMAETSRLRDLTQEETIRDFTAVVDDPDRLRMLYLLTYADTSAVGAGVWTEVKGRFLRDLCHRSERALLRDEDLDIEDGQALARTRKRLMKDLSVENLPAEEVAEHIESMPATYLLNTGLDEIALHVGFVRRAQQDEPVVDFYDERDSTVTNVVVCAKDDPTPGLLAKIAGVFYAADVGVHSAQVFTRRPAEGSPHSATGSAIAIDHFFVDFRGRQLTAGKRNEIARDMRAVLTGTITVRELLTKKQLDAEIGGAIERLTVRNDLSEAFTVIEVAAADARSMLYRVSGALSSFGWDIVSARASHFGGLSVASFYVSGAKHLGDAATLSVLRRIMPSTPSP